MLKIVQVVSSPGVLAHKTKVKNQKENSRFNFKELIFVTRILAILFASLQEFLKCDFHLALAASLTSCL